MSSYRELLERSLDRSNAFATELEPKRTIVLMLDVQLLCLHPDGADHVKRVGGAPSGADTLGPAKKVLGRARAEGMPLLWSMWGHRPDSSSIGQHRTGRGPNPRCEGVPLP